MNEELQIAIGLYRHNKTGNLYEVTGTALHTESEEVMVVYRPVAKDRHKLFVRPATMFSELVDISGRSVQRFEKVEDL